MAHIKVLDLFSGTQSVRKALEKEYGIVCWYRDLNNKMWTGYSIDPLHGERPCNIVEYLGIDIYSPEYTNHILDLSKKRIVKALKKRIGNWKPDFIWASPLCTPFSRATSVVNGTLAYRMTDGKLEIRKAEDFKEIKHRSYAHKVEDEQFIKKYQELGRIGLKLFENTREIINHYNVPFVIENPAGAMSQYIMKDLTRSTAAYCMYGFDYAKKTAFYSDRKLDLKRCDHKGPHKVVMSGNPTKTGKGATSRKNKDRAIVPQKLIREIIKQIMKEEKND